MISKKLTEQEKEVLVILMEECGELIQACSKVLRAGKKKEFISTLAQEVADVEVLIDLVESYGIVPATKSGLYLNKLNNLRKWSDLKV